MQKAMSYSRSSQNPENLHRDTRYIFSLLNIYGSTVSRIRNRPNVKWHGPKKKAGVISLRPKLEFVHATQKGNLTYAIIYMARRFLQEKFSDVRKFLFGWQHQQKEIIRTCPKKIPRTTTLSSPRM